MVGSISGNFGNGFSADANVTPFGYYQVSVSTAVTLASLSGGSLPAGARIVWILPEAGSNVRWRDDGTAPTASVGMPIVSQQAWPYEGSLAALQLVSQSGTATVNLWFVG